MIQELDKNYEVGETVTDLAGIGNKVWKVFEKFKQKIKIYKRPKNYTDLLVKKCNKEVWQDRMSARDLKISKI